MSKTVFSGIQPSGKFHLGNYAGIVNNLANFQGQGNRTFVSIVDLHAMTTFDYGSEQSLKSNCLELAKTLVALGLNKNVNLFIQGQNPDHTLFGWILETMTAYGKLRHMIQFKEKSTKKENFSVGLLTYPVLMAADILLYDADIVPVGEDQRQHVELARDIAQKFNLTFSEVFTLPECVVPENGARIKSLFNPLIKMSKSDPSSGCLYLDDSPDVVIKKLSKATTDNLATINYDSINQPGITNLIDIFSLVSGEKVEEITARYQGSGYGDFKKDLSEKVIDFNMTFQKNYQAIDNNPEKLEELLADGLKESIKVTGKKIAQVKNIIGLM